MISLQYIILLPILAGILLFILPEKIRPVKGMVSVLVSGIALYHSYLLFSRSGLPGGPPLVRPGGWSQLTGSVLLINADSLSRTIVLFVGFFGFLFSLYSLSYVSKKNIAHYYSYYLITVGCAAGAALSDHFLLFITLWGVLGLTLYKLIVGSDERSSAAAKKTFIMIGASDSIMIFGIGMLWLLTGTMKISGISVETSGWAGIVAFVALLIGSLTKAGAFPLHSWVPDYAQEAPASSSAFLPASLDKLLGIYLLARICTSLFTLNMWLRLALLTVGGITTITAVLMALVQHNYKRLLGYHAVSQVGYMVTGFGLGTALGVAGGLFHMFNNALYKSGLFLTAGSVEKRTGREDLDEIGGLSQAMPMTFISALVFSLSISGVPPFNGFASKWLIYQGIIDFGRSQGPANSVWIVWLVLALFGSALTLASFIKFVSGIYLGGRKKGLEKVREVSILMWLPQIIIAFACTVSGIAATRYVIPRFIIPISGEFSFSGLWSPGVVTGLILVSIALGFIIYLFGSPKKRRTAEGFTGGETTDVSGDFSTTEFYKTIQGFKPFGFFYRAADRGLFDLYDGTKRLVLGINSVFSRCHSGALPLYALWVVIGLVIVAAVLLV